jgi:hypothetical protein
MHCEKKFCENIIKHLWGEKYYPHGRIDFQEMQIKRELWLRCRGDSSDQFWMPHAPFKLKSHEKKEVLDTILSIQLPSNYAGPIHKRIQDGRLRYLKSHDFHILLQQVSIVEKITLIFTWVGMRVVLLFTLSTCLFYITYFKANLDLLRL